MLAVAQPLREAAYDAAEAVLQDLMLENAVRCTCVRLDMLPFQLVSSCQCVVQLGTPLRSPASGKAACIKHVYPETLPVHCLYCMKSVLQVITGVGSFGCAA